MKADPEGELQFTGLKFLDQSSSLAAGPKLQYSLELRLLQA